MKNFTIILRLVTATFVFSVLALCIVSNQPKEVRSSSPTANSEIRSFVNEASAKGMNCTKTPSLTDDIIFTTTEGTTKWVTFDQALAGSQDGKGTVELYCTR